VPNASIFDAYTALCHLAGIDFDISNSTPAWSPPSWRAIDSQRRLHAYRILAGYVNNAARFSRVGIADLDARKEIREYGDPRLRVNRIVAGVIGSGPVFTVEGAQMPPMTAPELDQKRPADADTGDPELDRVIDQVRDEVWPVQARKIVDDWAEAHRRWPDRAAWQEWVDDWLEAEGVAAKVYANEANGVVPLGDGVLVVSWDTERARPTVDVFEPDAYEPVLVDDGDSAYPEKVHLVWEFERRNGNGKLSKFVHRITYELVDVPARRLRYQDPAAAPSAKTCLVTDMTWPLSGPGTRWPDLDDKAGTAAVNAAGVPVIDLDLGIDYIPVVHIPNTPPPGSDHFGFSSIANTAQMYDDLASLDTDIVKAAALAGSPAVWTAGANLGAAVTLNPGTIYGLPPEGRMFSLDLSAGLTALLAAETAMQERLDVNSEVPGAILGRVGSDQIPSGTALALSFAPFEQLVSVLRLTRYQKYALLAKFAMRLAQVNAPDTVPAGPTPPVSVAFASSVPTDLAGTVKNVVELLRAKAVPRRLALQLLRDAGLHDEDLGTLVQAIQAEDAEGAKAMAEAAGPDAADRYLGLEPDETPPPAPPPPPPPPLDTAPL
jgi:hypothetical protein